MSYRNDLEAARERRDALARELRTIATKMDELEALNQRKQELERDLKKSSSDLDQARARVSLPLLSKVKVASPCHASWDAMTGDERVRFCGQCDKSVFDLSAMVAEQAESLLREHGASLCVRFYRRRDGTVMTSDCPVGKRQKRKRTIAAAVLAGGLMTAGIGGFLWSNSSDSGCDPTPDEITGVTMGAVAPMVETAPPPPEPDDIEPLMGKIDLSEVEMGEAEVVMGEAEFVEPSGQDASDAE